MGKHALLSPSSASRWMTCPGSVSLTKDLPEQSSKFAEEGTFAHRLAELSFAHDKPPSFWVGGKIRTEDGELEVTQEMADFVTVYTDYIRREANGKKFLFEQRLSLTPITGEPDAEGTSDAVMIDGDSLTIVDLKFGMGVKVSAAENEQLMLYAEAARLRYEVLGPFRNFKVVIVQPRLDWIDEWDVGQAYLENFIGEVKRVSPSALDGTGELNPSEEACRWCKAKATCPALTEFVFNATSAGFDNLDKTSEVDLSKSMAATAMIEDWISAVRAETERRLIAGEKVPGWKIVKGRMGARQWTDAKAVEEMMKKSMRLPDTVVYKFSLISPTQAEKTLADQPKRWETLQEFIMRKEGSPSVAPSTDPRPEIGSVVDSFSDLGKDAA